MACWIVSKVAWQGPKAMSPNPSRRRSCSPSLFPALSSPQTPAFALRLIAFVTVPATVGLIVLRGPIVRVLFEGGRFGARDTAATAGALATLAAGLFFFAGVRVLVPAFYALKSTTLPVLAALADASAFLLLCALLTRPLGLPGIGLAEERQSDYDDARDREQRRQHERKRHCAGTRAPISR